MNEGTNSAVIDLCQYRRRAELLKQPKPDPAPIPERLLDEVSYHLLMAVRAIAAHTDRH